MTIEPDEAALWDRVKQGDLAARNELIVRYLDLVWIVVSDLSPLKATEREEWFSHGVLGLISAIGKFDVTRGVAFRTYARYVIKGAIHHENRLGEGRLVREKAGRVGRAKELLQGQLGRNPTMAELAEEMEVPTSKVWGWLRDLEAMRRSSLDAEPRPAEDRPIGRQGAAGTEVPSVRDCPASSYGVTEIRELVAGAIEQLDERGRTVLAMRYLWGMRLREVADVMGLGTTRVFQLESEALRAVARILSERAGAA